MILYKKLCKSSINLVKFIDFFFIFLYHNSIEKQKLINKILLKWRHENWEK